MQGLQNARETVGGRQPIDQRRHDTRFGQFPAHRFVRAGGSTPVDGLSTAIVVVDFAVAPSAAARRHRHLTAAALDQAAEERRSAVEAGATLPRLSLAELVLDRVEDIRIDDLRDPVIDDVTIRILVAVFVEHIPGSGAGIDLPDQHLVDGAGIEFGAPPGVITGCVQMLDDRTYAHRARRSFAIQREMEKETNDLGLDGIDLRPSLYGSADGVGFDRAVTERGGPAVGVAQLIQSIAGRPTSAPS